ncbi:hypothetical protein VTJ04DRAFT_117 [Mycothermus thermophilus]|uniref:uncharacterized protein n=1 Tax=Humicola insolens TaxID=85995 RepID=UPI003743B0D7
MGPRLATSPGLPARPRGLLVTVCLISLLTIWMSRLPKMCLYGDASTSLTTHSHSNPPAQPTVDLSRADAPFISWPLARVCRETTTWSPHLIFLCDNNSGGIGNIRNYILTCLRYAIDAGAGGLVLPRISTRSEKDLSNIHLDQRGFDYFFDEAHFRRSLHEACPQITVYDTLEAVPGSPAPPRKSDQLTPHDLGRRGGCDSRELNKHTGLFARQFHAWLNKTAAESDGRLAHPPTRDRPRAVRFNWGVQWDWPVFRDGPEFVATFGGLLRFRSDILDLGMRAAGYMREFARKHQTGMATSKSPRFAGFHLRTESDALSRWPKFDEQSGAYLSRAEEIGFKAAYLATGNVTDAKRFVDLAKEKHGISVITKQDLLREYGAARDDLAALQALTWDQQGVVDFIVLLESDYFFGVSPSSFSINVAGKRHLKEEGLYTRPWRIGGEGDGRSWLAGNYEHYWEDWLFMFDSLWP